MSKRNLKQRFFLPADLWARELDQSLIEECGLLMRIAATSTYAGYIVFYPTTIRVSHSLRTRTLVVNSFSEPRTVKTARKRRFRCHGLAPWRLTLTATNKNRRNS